MQKGAIIRRLGFTEAFFTEVQARGAGTLMVVGCFGFRGTLGSETLRATLAALHARFPLLRATVSRDDAGFPVFVETASFTDIPIGIMVGETADHWARIFDEEFDRPLDHARALWRVTLIHAHEAGARSWLLVAMDHSITDGLSWIAFATAFELAHAAVAAGRSFDAAPLAVNPPVEALLAARRRANPVPAAPPEPGDPWRHAKRTPVRDRRTRYRHVRLGTVRTMDLVARCHAHQVTVNDALLAAYAKAIAAADGAPERFVVAVPHNIRDAAEPPISPAAMGAFVVEIPVICDRASCAETAFWTLATALGTAVRAGMPAAMATTGGAVAPTIVEQAVDATLDPARDVFAKAVLSNLGAPSIGERPDGLSVDRLSIGVSMQAGANALFLTVATIAGALNISLGACHPLIRPTDHKALADRFVELLAAG